uniref:Uncharacterized protein n=1 Tax=Anguilla anguilla TaxID=7936 RepID=A0A0E9VWX8_ANGAN
MELIESYKFGKYTYGKQVVLVIYIFNFRLPLLYASIVGMSLNYFHRNPPL